MGMGDAFVLSSTYARKMERSPTHLAGNLTMLGGWS